jgi:hypothetical protein
MVRRRMRKTRRSRTKKNVRNMRISTLHAAIALVLLSSAYGLFQARELLRGPVLTVYNPHENSTIEQALFTVHGRAENVIEVRINGRAIATDTEGYFEDTFATPNGLGLMHVAATDRFGRTTEEYIPYVGRPQNIASQSS